MSTALRCAEVAGIKASDNRIRVLECRPKLKAKVLKRMRKELLIQTSNKKCFYRSGQLSNVLRGVNKPCFACNISNI